MELDFIQALNAVNNVMVKLRTMKITEKHRHISHLGATSSIETTWTDKYDMLPRHHKIQDPVREILEMEDDLPSAAQLRVLKGTMNCFSKFEAQ